MSSSSKSLSYFDTCKTFRIFENKPYICQRKHYVLNIKYLLRKFLGKWPHPKNSLLVFLTSSFFWIIERLSSLKKDKSIRKVINIKVLLIKIEFKSFNLN